MHGVLERSTQCSIRNIECSLDATMLKENALYMHIEAVTNLGKSIPKGKIIEEIVI